jgi:hypothetical protein
MNIIFQVFTAAVPVWEQALRQVSWYQCIVAMAYWGVAWLCLLNAHIAEGALEANFTWYAAAGVLCTLGANTVLHGDVLVTHVFRSAAKLEGWYGQRRLVQYLVIAGLTLVAFFAARRLRSKFTACHIPSESVALGLTALVILLLVRTVSAHGTDAVMNHHVAGISLGRLFELAGIGFVLHGALSCLRIR